MNGDDVTAQWSQYHSRPLLCNVEFVRRCIS